MVVVIAVLCLAAGSAAQPKVDFPWDRDGPAAATRHLAAQLVRAQQQAQETQDVRKALSSRLVKEQIDQESDRVALDRAEADQTEKAKKRVVDRDALMAVLRTRLDAAVEAQVVADSAVRVGAEKAKKSERAATHRLSWLTRVSRAVLALLVWTAIVLLLGLQRLVRFRRVRLVHARFAVPGSLAVLVILLAALSLGWVAAALILLVLLAGWVFRPGGQHV